MKSAVFEADVAADAIVRLLALRGTADLSKQPIVEALAADASFGAVAETLREHGLRTRVVEVPARRLRALEMPTLIKSMSGGPIVLMAAGLTRVRLELADGRMAKLSYRDFAKHYSGAALDVAAVATARGSLVRRVLGVLFHKPSYVLALFALTLVANGFDFATTEVSRIAVDQALPDGAKRLLLTIVVGTILMAFHDAALRLMRQAVVRYLDVRVESATSKGVFDHAMRLPLAFHQRKGVGPMMQALGSVHAIGEALTDHALLPILNGTFAAIYLLRLAVTVPSAAVGVLCVAVVSFIVSQAWGRRMETLERSRIRVRSKEQNAFFELLEGVATTKAVGAERRVAARWLGFLIDGQGFDVKRSLAVTELGIFGDGVQQLTRIGLLVWCARETLAGNLTLGAMLQTLQVASGFLSTMGAFSGAAAQQWVLRAHASNLDEMLEAEAEEGAASRPREDNAVVVSIASGAARAGRRNLGDAIVVDDVWFRHDRPSPWILEGYSLRVPFGEVRHLRDASGSGKTTLLRLISGLYEPERGTVRIFGLHPRAARGLIAYLPQDAYLFEGSLRRNLTLLSANAGMDRIAAAAEATGLAAVVKELPMGLDTRVPAGGGNLSGGQRQLVALTACVASRKPIVLLDEATSHLDRVLQARILQSGLLRGRTVLSVDHFEADVVAPRERSRALVTGRNGE